MGGCPGGGGQAGRILLWGCAEFDQVMLAFASSPTREFPSPFDREPARLGTNRVPIISDNPTDQT